jgi:hypothetical protein
MFGDLCDFFDFYTWINSILIITAYHNSLIDLLELHNYLETLRTILDSINITQPMITPPTAQPSPVSFFSLHFLLWLIGHNAYSNVTFSILPTIPAFTTGTLPMNAEQLSFKIKVINELMDTCFHYSAQLHVAHQEYLRILNVNQLLSTTYQIKELNDLYLANTPPELHSYINSISSPQLFNTQINKIDLEITKYTNDLQQHFAWQRQLKSQLPTLVTLKPHSYFFSLSLGSFLTLILFTIAKSQPEHLLPF